MRLAGIFAVLALVGIAAVQSIVGGAPESEADDTPLVLAASDICIVEAGTGEVWKTETREIVTTPAHKQLTVIPARYGTRIDTVEIVPEHREGATFFTEPRRVIVSEPTRRLRAIPAVIDPAPAVGQVAGKIYRVEGGKLIEKTVMRSPQAALQRERILVRESRIDAVRISAGLKMLETKVIDTDGDGEIVPAETMDIEVRTVEAHPSVETRDVPAVTETVEIREMETPARRVEVEAVCTLAARDRLLRRVRNVLLEKGETPEMSDSPKTGIGEPGTWSIPAIDMMAMMQAREFGLVSPYLLLDTLRVWLPDVDLPTS